MDLRELPSRGLSHILPLSASLTAVPNCSRSRTDTNGSPGHPNIHHLNFNTSLILLTPLSTHLIGRSTPTHLTLALSHVVPSSHSKCQYLSVPADKSFQINEISASTMSERLFLNPQGQVSWSSDRRGVEIPNSSKKVRGED